MFHDFEEIIFLESWVKKLAKKIRQTFCQTYDRKIILTTKKYNNSKFCNRRFWYIHGTD